MIDLVSPLWLSGLAGLAAVWWIHRRGATRPFPVPALFLWRDAEAAGSRTRRARESDPMWLLRAAVLALLLAALSGVCLMNGAPGVTVWLDDSASMAAREKGGTRRAQALEMIAREAAGRRVEILALQPFAASQPDAEHWLVTDGADPRINELAASGQFHRVLLVGSETENVGITRIALRRSLADPGHIVGQVRVVNGGTTEARRTMTIATSQRTVRKLPVSIAPDSKAEVTFVTETLQGPITATLYPGDALAADDTIEVSTDRLHPLDVTIGVECATELQAALATHPGVRVTDGKPGSTSIVCEASTDWSDPAEALVKFNQLLDTVVGRNLLDPIVSEGFPAQEAYIAPHAVDWVKAVPDKSPAASDATHLLAGTAAALVLADLLVLLTGARRGAT